MSTEGLKALHPKEKLASALPLVLGERDKNHRNSEQSLSAVEFVLFALLFLFVPLANIIVGHVAYHHWKITNPAKARAVNDLSIGTFLLQVLPLVVLGFIFLAIQAPR